MDKELLPIREAAKFMGVKPSTLRRWDRIGKLTPVGYSSAGYRQYTREQLQNLKEGRGQSTAQQETSNFNPEEFIAGLREITEDGLYTFSSEHFPQLRVLRRDPKLYFCLPDTVAALELTNSSKTLSDLRRKYQLIGVDIDGLTVSYPIVDKVGRLQYTTMVEEQLFYKLFSHSDKPKALILEQWVHRDVIPAIRQHGLYAPTEMAKEFMKNPKAMVDALTALIEEQERNKLLSAKLAESEAQLAESEPLVAFAQKCLKSEDTMMIREFAKLLTDNNFVIGQNNLYKVLRKCNCILKNSTEPTQYAMNQGWFEIEQRPYETADGLVRTVKTTKITPKGQAHLIFKLCNDPQFRRLRPAY